MKHIKTANTENLVANAQPQHYILVPDLHGS